MLKSLLMLPFILFTCFNLAASIKHTEDKLNGTYDFIIVGAGTAGSVLASRLSEVENWKILVLEAGSDYHKLAKIPSITPLWQQSQLSWGYYAQHQNGFFKGLNDSKMLWPSGKALGGSTAINYMIYSRGNPHDYQRWQDSIGSEWAHDKVLPYYLKSEQAKMKYLDKSSHAFKGPLHVQHSYHSSTTTDLIKAFHESGYSVVDYNSKNQLGFSTVQATIRSGYRCSTYDAFITPIANRTNLNILTEAFVTKITFDKTHRAKAVKFIRNKRKFRAIAQKEIILCAGTFNTPKILQLSGLGDRKRLEDLDIPFVKDLPGIGKHLVDHPMFVGLNFVVDSNETMINHLIDFVRDVPNWTVSGQGRFSSLAGIEALGFLKLPKSPISQQHPDFEVLIINPLANRVLKEMLNMKNSTFQALHDKSKHFWAIYPILLHPKSRGYMDLQSKRPADSPLLYSNLLTHDKDVKGMTEAIRTIVSLFQRPQFQKLGVRLLSNQIPECRGESNIDYWECAIRALVVSANNPMGTCKMGLENDKLAVVNHQFGVYKVQNLRIVDASVIPITLSGHIMAPVIMMAEKAAQFIKSHYKK